MTTNSLRLLFGNTGIYSPDRIEQARVLALKGLKGNEKHLLLIKAQIENKAEQTRAAEIASLHISPESQRHVGHKDTEAALKAAVRIIRGFDINAFETTSIATRKNDKRSVVDGGHRTLVAAIVGATAVPADVWNSSGEEYEAEVFVKMNAGRRNVNSVHKVRNTAIYSPNSMERHTVDAIKAAGLSITTDTFKGLGSIVGTTKRLAKVLGGVEEAQTAVTNGINLYLTLWDEDFEQDIAAAVIYILSDTDMTKDEQEAFAETVLDRWPSLKGDEGFMNHVQPLIGSSHRHGTGRVAAAYAELLTVTGLPEDRIAEALMLADERENGKAEDDDSDRDPEEKATPMTPDAFMVFNLMTDEAQIEKSWTPTLIAKELGGSVPTSRIKEAIAALSDTGMIVNVGKNAYAPAAA